MFHPGETVVHIFIIPFGVNSISEIIVSYKQNDHIILERTITSAMLNPDNPNGTYYLPYEDPTQTKFQLQLSQDESLLFEDYSDFTIQLNVYTFGRTRHASCEIKSSNGIQHHREVISHG